MPNRIIKESIWTSPNLNKLSVYAERHFYRLLLAADDYGCFESTPAVVRGKCYPLKEKMSIKNIEEWQRELEAKNIIISWEDSERQFSIYRHFEKHNTRYCVTENGRPTRHRRKTPPPPDNILNKINETNEIVKIWDEDSLPAFASLGQSLPNPNPNPNINTLSSKVINYLNEKTGKKFKSNNKETQRLINARCQSGFKYDDFVKVIDVKVSKWIKDPNMCDYLRPQTLFGTKFESYLNEDINKTNRKQPKIITAENRHELYENP